MPTPALGNSRNMSENDFAWEKLFVLLCIIQMETFILFSPSPGRHTEIARKTKLSLRLPCTFVLPSGWGSTCHLPRGLSSFWRHSYSFPFANFPLGSLGPSWTRTLGCFRLFVSVTDSSRVGARSVLKLLILAPWEHMLVDRVPKLTHQFCWRLSWNFKGQQMPKFFKTTYEQGPGLQKLILSSRRGSKFPKACWRYWCWIGTGSSRLSHLA